MSRHIYTMSRPATWYGEQWREALPLGNGYTGVLVPGAIAEESIHFNRHDLWGHGDPGAEIPDISDTFAAMRRAIDAGDYAAANQDNVRDALKAKGYSAACETPYPLGWLKLSFAPDKMFRGYRRGVNMRTGEAFVNFAIDGCAFSRRAFVSRDSDVTVLRMTADRPFTALYDFKLFEETGEAETTGSGLLRRSANTAARVVFTGDYSSVVKGDALEVTGSDYTVLVRCSSHGSPLDMDGVLGRTYDELLARHTALHTPLYDAMTIELADDEAHLPSNESMLDEAYEDAASPALIERLWRFGRYLFISGTAENSNPVPLYGIWHGDDRLQWSQYVANENVEITYWHALPGGLSYALPALIRYYTSKTATFRECARKVFGMNGIWISAYTTPGVAGVGVPAAVISNWISCAGWLCRHFWEYYLYTGDEAMLRGEILPFMHEAALFYRDYAVTEGDTLRLYPSVSPENTPGNLLTLPTKTATGHNCPVVQNATMDFAIMKELLTNLLTGVELTGMYADEANSFRALLERIPAYGLNEDGAVREWQHDDLKDNYHHRHLSHIYPVFPGCEVTAHNAPELFEAFRRAVELRKLGSQSGWSLTHMANIYARFGEAERAVECLDIMAKSVVCNSLLTVHNDWRHMGMTVDWKEAPIQLDAAFGAVNAIQEMLLCWQAEALSVLPALPARLSHGCMRGMRFPGGALDVRWEESGRVVLTVHAERDIDTDLLLCGRLAGRAVVAAGESRTWELERA